MQVSRSLIALVATFAASFGMIALVSAARRRAATELACPIIALAIMPPLAMLGLFYSLAIHMRQSLGAWPSSIGERGFPPPLVAHAHIASNYFLLLILFDMLVLPIAILLCLLVPRWKRFVPYFALYALLFVICWGLMQLAPEPFLRWWRD